jgi:hypothetical protein
VRYAGENRLKAELYVPISLLILIFLVLQVSASLRVLCLPERISHYSSIRLCDPYLWPFLSYPMFDRPHFPGEQANRARMVGILEDHTEVRISYIELGTRRSQFQNIHKALRISMDTELAQAVAQLYEQNTNRRLLAIKLGFDTHVYTGTGFSPTGYEELATFWLSGTEQ